MVEGCHINEINADNYMNIIALCPNHQTEFEQYQNTMKTIYDEMNKDLEYSHSKIVEETMDYYEKIEIKKRAGEKYISIHKKM